MQKKHYGIKKGEEMKKRSKTLQEEWDEVGKSLRELILVIAEELGLRKLLDQLVKKRKEKGETDVQNSIVSYMWNIYGQHYSHDDN